MPEELSDHLEELSELSLQIARSMRRTMARVCKGMNIVQIYALLAIEQQPGMTMKELAQRLQISCPSATTFIQRFVRLGWVERFTAAENRKQVHLRLTVKGRVLVHEKKKERSLVLARMFAVISLQDQRSLLEILRRILARIEEVPSPHA